jgi:hypothetical protein
MPSANNAALAQRRDILGGIAISGEDFVAVLANRRLDFSRLRRAEYGVHHRISGKYLYQYANEMAWREDNRRVSNGINFKLVTAAALRHPKSAVWAGYWQRAAA